MLSEIGERLGTPDMFEQAFAIREYGDAKDFETAGFRVTPRRVLHYDLLAFGFRLGCNGKTLAYSGDSGPSDQLEELARDADLFLCEASYLDGMDNPPDLHLTGTEAGEAATKADVGRLLLTHLVPAWGSEVSTVEAAGAAYAGPVEVVRPGSRYHL